MSNSEKTNAAIDRLLSSAGGVRDIVQYGKLGDNVAILVLTLAVSWYGDWDGIGIAVVTFIVAGILNKWEKRRL